MAIESIVKEINRGLLISYEGLNQFKNTLNIVKKSKQNLEILLNNEKTLDIIQYEVTSYIKLLGTSEIDEKISKAIPEILHATNDLERIGDHQQNLYKAYKRCGSLSIILPESIYNKLVSSLEIKLEFINFLSNNLVNNLEIDINKANYYENQINNLKNSFQDDYYCLIKKFKNECSISTILYDYVLNIEKIRDHLLNMCKHLSTVSKY